MSQKFYDLLKQTREESGLTQQYLAEKLGISLSAYQYYEYKTIPPHDKLVKLNKLLKCDLSRAIYQEEVGTKDTPVDLNTLKASLDELAKGQADLHTMITTGLQLVSQTAAKVEGRPLKEVLEKANKLAAAVDGEKQKRGTRPDIPDNSSKRRKKQQS